MKKLAESSALSRSAALAASPSRLENAPRELKKGNSIAVSGVCLTAIEITPNSFRADLAEETWRLTSLSRITEGALVNLELPMKADGRMGGHIVQGHVDGTGKFLGLERIPGAEDFWLQVEVPPELERYVVYKGSHCDRRHQPDGGADGGQQR